MTHKDPDTRQAYMEAWRAQRHAEARLILCACGCGGTLKEYDRHGRVRRYIFGHGKKKPAGHVAPRILKAKLILCECGCGETLREYSRHGNKQRYIYGHVHNKVYESVTPPPMAELSDKVTAKRNRASRWARKIAVLKHYGGDPPKCSCCGEKHLQFLAVDHINRDGAEQRRALGNKGGNPFYGWLIKNGLPFGFRVLCHNCNMAIGIWGHCPHETERVTHALG